MLPTLAADTLKADKDFMLACDAAGKHGGALEYAAEVLKADKDFMLTVVKQNGYALALMADKQVVLAQSEKSTAVTHYGFALGFVDDAMKADKDVALAAVTQAGIGALENSGSSAVVVVLLWLHSTRQKQPRYHRARPKDFNAGTRVAEAGARERERALHWTTEAGVECYVVSL